MKPIVVAAALVILGGLPLGADDDPPLTIGNIPVRLSVSLDQDHRPPPPPAASKEPDVRLWYELAINASFEYLAGSLLSGSVLYSDAYYDTTAPEAQLAMVIAWVPHWGLFHDAMIRPHVGYSYRDFIAHSFTDATGLRVSPNDILIQAAYVGVTFASGHLPDDGEFGFMGYVTLQLGAAFIDGTDVQAPALFVGRQHLIKATTNFYVSGGVGAEFMLERVSFRFEVGFRDFGAPRDGGSRIVLTKDTIGVVYVLFGITFAF